MTTIELQPYQTAQLALEQLDELLQTVRSLPETKKRTTTMRYLWTAQSNLKFLYEATQPRKVPV